MSDDYDYYPCNIISIKKDATVKIDKKDAKVNIVKLNVTYDKNLTGTVEYYAKKLSSTSSNSKIITLTPETEPLYLRIRSEKKVILKKGQMVSPAIMQEVLLIWKTSKDRAIF